MIRWYPIFQRHITEHPCLQLLIVSSHSCFLSRIRCGLAVVFQQPPKALAGLPGSGPRAWMVLLDVAPEQLSQISKGAVSNATVGE